MSLIEELLHARVGPMTSELVQRPGGFGLGQLPARLQPVATTNLACGFCSTGCGLRAHLDEEGRAINLSPDPDHPVNLGMACPKGWEALAPLDAPDRATRPLRRDPGTGTFTPISWGQALETFVGRFRSIQEAHGAESVAVLSTGQIVTEEMALLGALTKFGMGIRHLDSNTRQCMATSHTAYKQSFGFDAPPFTYADFEESDALIFIGANPCIAHPIMWQRVMANRRNPEIVVLDPRRTETAMAATLHVALQPKSDLTLLYGIAHLLIERGAVKREFVDAHTSGFDDFARFVSAFLPARVAAETGVPIETLHRMAAIIAERERVSFWWTMGVNQGHESTRTAQAIINLALMTGNIGRPGTGANSITGQCNAMGSRLFGNATSLLGGHAFGNPEHRAKVGGILGISPEVIPDRPGHAYDQIIDAIARGEIRGLWVIATNPAHSWINRGRFDAIRRQLDFLVVQDMYPTTETARTADLVLPAAGWGEKEGTFINSERRLGLVKKVRRAPGEALSDFAIFKLVADAWGCGEQFRQWASPAATFRLMQELSRGQPCDITGIGGYAHLDAAGGIQWPWTAADAAANDEARMTNDETGPSGIRNSGFGIRNSQPDHSHSDFDVRHSDGDTRHRRLFADGRFFTPDGRARFYFDAPQPMPEAPDDAYPFLLLTGRGTSAQWHTGSRTDKSDVLRKLAPAEIYAEINPVDVKRLGLEPGGRVTLHSRRGRIVATVFATPTIQPGQVFLPMHYVTVNLLTFAAFDPHSRQPAYKACAVRLEKAE